MCRLPQSGMCMIHNFDLLGVYAQRGYAYHFKVKHLLHTTSKTACSYAFCSSAIHVNAHTCRVSYFEKLCVEFR